MPLTALQHKLGDHAVELGALVVQRFALFADALLSSAQSAEIGHRLGHHIAEQAHDDTSGWLAINLNVEEHLSEWT